VAWSGVSHPGFNFVVGGVDQTSGDQVQPAWKDLCQS
jgi:hypothetical protein